MAASADDGPPAGAEAQSGARSAVSNLSSLANLPNPPNLIYLVDDDPEETARIAAVVHEATDYLVKAFRSPSLARSALLAEPVPPTVLICEQEMREADGIAFLAAVRQELPDTVRVLLTAHADKQSLMRAVNEGGVFQYVEKPWDPEALLLVVRNAIERGDLVATLRRTVAAMQHNNQALSTALRQIHAAQERLLESERMAAVGRVASGIAHEIGNQLSVLSYAELIRDRYPDDGEIRLFTAAILSARARLGGLVGEIRDFSRVHGGLPRNPAAGSPPAQPRIELSEEPVNLSVQEALSILRFDPAFRLRTVDRALDCPAVARVNRDKLVQVFVNLLRNALDATAPGGEIHLRIVADPLVPVVPASPGDPDGPKAEAGPAAATGTAAAPMVRIVIDDHGAGIAPDIMSRIFEPFFTTKGDRGTGLGLGICRSIVAQHEGQLIVESPVPAPLSASGGHPGTRVTVTLPRVA
ncbi:MAG TPA: hybrid sensor histidine kinase/response regulator [Pseudomonadota bacterium]|nr:hybrid sensor histidine kinase/response regulator [Pseudomonadota bacterium]